MTTRRGIGSPTNDAETTQPPPDSKDVGGGNFGNNYFNVVLIAFVLLGLAYYSTSTTRYENFKTRAVLVSNTITVKELQKQVYDIINVDPNDYEITIIAMYETMKSALPVEIADDDDARAFIFESRLKSYKIPLCITLEETNLLGSPQVPDYS
ncbi:uncharacterized protein LOC109948547 isoform X3 [Prunus persica]|uniref:uncharacterized protein LOC109948547 isoform X3 n=1 Tax=Prunus persica TaxID=3760 RepID=UPI0009AB8662|nr:uncharacterized protein LOC109948547 isoform X3 [Prunus persica]